MSLNQDQVTITSVIKGIHKTKVGANRLIDLLVENDDHHQNIDPNCMVVRMPSLENIPTSLHKSVTYPKSRNPRDPRQTDQLVEDVAGKIVGNVPANLCGLLRKLKQDGVVTCIKCLAVGERPLPSAQPPSKQKFLKMQRGLDRRGGGLVLECQYILGLCPGVSKQEIVEECRGRIAEMKGSETVY